MNKPKVPQTNVEFVTEAMEFSKYGAVAQMFIMDALMKVAKHVAETPIEEVRRQFGEDSFINPDAWHGAAVELNDKFKEKYGK